MKKTIYSKMSKDLQDLLVSMRKNAGLTQRELAKKLNREHSFIARIELGERRVDVIEFYFICEACDASPEKMIRNFYKDS